MDGLVKNLVEDERQVAIGGLKGFDKVTLSVMVKDALFQKLLNHNQSIHKKCLERFKKHQLVYKGETFKPLP